jgi:hypothetical protein
MDRSHGVLGRPFKELKKNIFKKILKIILAKNKKF